MTLEKQRLKIVADENIPMLQQLFGTLGEIHRVSGRHINPSQVSDADVLLVRSVTQVNRQLLQGSRVRFVGTCTIGIDHLDVEYLNESGIVWSNAPGCNANSVVEYVFSALARVRPDWLQARVGIIGCGNVGGHLYRQLQRLGLECHCYDPFLTTTQNPDLTTLDQVLNCDVISLHAPLTRDGEHPSYHLLDAARLQQLRPGTVIISAGRGGVIDNQALKRLLQQRNDLTVVLDVWEPEPELDPELLALVDLGTPHIAGYSFDGKVTGSMMICRALYQFLGLKFTLPAELSGPDEEAQSLLAVQGESTQELLNSAILGAYDVQRDDNNLRQLLSTPVHQRAGFFDGLRKNYPVRREFRFFSTERLLDGVAEDKKKPLKELLAIIELTCL